MLYQFFNFKIQFFFVLLTKIREFFFIKPWRGNGATVHQFSRFFTDGITLHNFMQHRVIYKYFRDVLELILGPCTLRLINIQVFSPGVQYDRVNPWTLEKDSNSMIANHIMRHESSSFSPGVQYNAYWVISCHKVSFQNLEKWSVAW